MPEGAFNHYEFLGFGSHHLDELKDKEELQGPGADCAAGRTAALYGRLATMGQVN